MKTNVDKQAVKYVPEGDGELALKIFRKVWPEKYKAEELVFRLSDRTLTFDGRAFVLRFKKVKRGRDAKGLKHEMKRSLEVFNMVLTMRLPVYAHPDFRERVRKAQDEVGPKFLKACSRLEDFAASLPEAKHSAKWGYANALLGTVNIAIKEPK